MITSSSLAFLLGGVRLRLNTFPTFHRRMFTTQVRGTENGKDFRRFFRNDRGQLISPMHDIPMLYDKNKNIFNVVVEVPRWTNAKMELSVDEELNPIKQDVKNGQLRYVANCFPFNGYIWNYGFVPQTWEDPEHIDPFTKCKGDSDPVDICEIGTKIHPQGSIIQVKVLGTIALIDDGETDWKILAVDVTDPLADRLHDVDDIDKVMPGFLDATVEWFRVYKMPFGKSANKFAFDGRAKDRAFALNILNDVHKQWKSLMSRSDSNIARTCTQFDSQYKIDSNEAENFVLQHANPGSNPLPIPEEVQKWHYLK